MSAKAILKNFTGQPEGFFSYHCIHEMVLVMMPANSNCPGKAFSATSTYAGGFQAVANGTHSLTGKNNNAGVTGAPTD